MASMEAHDWWADVQSHRDELDGRRRVAVWTDEELDLVPADILERPMVSDELAERRRRRFVREQDEARVPAGTALVDDDADADRHEREAEDAAAAAARRAARLAAGRPDTDFFADGPVQDPGPRFRFVRTEHEHEPRPSADEIEALTTAAPPVPGERRTVRITGRPEAATAPVPPARRQAGERRPPISTRERVQHRPDRIALWAALLGFLLIVIAFTSSDASAATALIAR